MSEVKSIYVSRFEIIASYLIMLTFDARNERPLYGSKGWNFPPITELILLWLNPQIRGENWSDAQLRSDPSTTTGYRKDDNDNEYRIDDWNLLKVKLPIHEVTEEFPVQLVLLSWSGFIALEIVWQ